MEKLFDDNEKEFDLESFELYELETRLEMYCPSGTYSQCTCTDTNWTGECSQITCVCVPYGS